MPTRTVFNNAAGVDRKVCDRAHTTEPFERCAAHCGFRHTFHDPYSSNEKGNVEKKVGASGRNLFVPVPQAWDVEALEGRLLGRCMSMAAKPNWIKGEPERQLFVEDCFAMFGLPEAPFDCVAWEERAADKKGKVAVGGRCGAWQNSRVRAALPDALREHMDSLGGDELRREPGVMRDHASASGWDATLQAVTLAFESTGRVDEASVAVTAARVASGTVFYDEPVDLGVYDEFMGASRG